MGKTNSKIPPHELRDLAYKTHFDEQELKRWYKGFIKDCPDGQLSREQFVELYSSFYGTGDAKNFAANVFRTFDVNSDGTIDFREFISSLSVATRGTLEEKLRWAFNIYDVDGNGYITESEMMCIVKSVAKMVGAMNDSNLSHEKMRAIFRNFDVNGDGMLSMEEFIEGARQDHTFVAMLTMSG